MRTFIPVVIAFFLLGAAFSFAQTQSIIIGADTETQPDGGIMRRVAVDPSGRLIGGGAQASCSPVRSTHTKTFMDAGVQTMGTPVMNRTYIVVSNNGDDIGGGSGFIKCRADGVSPSLTAGTPGATLTVGQSVLFTNRGDAGVKCIGSSLWTGAYECTP